MSNRGLTSRPPRRNVDWTKGWQCEEGHCETQLPPNSRLCTHCQKWNARRHVFNETRLSDCRNVTAFRRKKQCLLCREILEAVLKAIDERPALASVEVSVLEIGNQGPLYYEHDEKRLNVRCEFLLILSENAESWFEEGRFEVPPGPVDVGHDRYWNERFVSVPLFLRYETEDGVLLEATKRASSQIDYEEVRQLLTTCRTGHSPLCQTGNQELPPRFKLIDTQEMCIVEVAPNTRVSFAALSYVWAATAGETCKELRQAANSELRAPGGLKQQDYPMLIWDFLTLGKALGERYLWTDRLCIIQDDPIDKPIQINAMDAIYRNASFTIIVTADPNQDRGIPGSLTRPRQSPYSDILRNLDRHNRKILSNMRLAVNDSNWNTRGWCFQERELSRRCIYISNHTWYFSCGETTYEESYGMLSEKDFLEPMTERDHRPVHMMQSGEDWLDSVMHYTTRQLSFDTDVLNAFAGFSKLISDSLDSEVSFGLPETLFVEALLWDVAPPHRRRRSTPEIPSWSWAAWEGRVELYPYWNMMCTTRSPGRLVTYRIVDNDGTVRKVKAKDVWMNYNDEPHEEFEISQNDPGFLPWNRLPRNMKKRYGMCMHSREAMILHDRKFDGESLRAAPTVPGSLLFHTTVARLTMKSFRSAQYGTNKPLEILAMCDYEGNIVGIVSKDPLEDSTGWIEVEMARPDGYSVAVLSAHFISGVNRSSLNNGWDEGGLPGEMHGWLGEEDEDGMYGNWMLNVMIMTKNQGGVYERVALGLVVRDLWDACLPKWEYVVLR